MAMAVNQYYNGENSRGAVEDWMVCDYFSRMSNRAYADFQEAVLRVSGKTEEDARRDLIEEAADVYNALGFLLGVDEHIQAYNIIQKKKDRWLGRIEEAKMMAEVIKETKEEFGGWDE
jgi:hypothetical protein